LAKSKSLAVCPTVPLLARSNLARLIEVTEAALAKAFRPSAVDCKVPRMMSKPDFKSVSPMSLPGFSFSFSAEVLGLAADSTS
jgi:hypothetical protein